MLKGSLFTLALAASLTPGALAAQGGGNQVTLPEGEGKDLVQSVCTQCHGLNQIVGATGYTQDRWRDLFSTMVNLPDAQATLISRYLATNFAPKNDRPPVLVSGPVQIKITEWIAPTLGSRSRDPIEAPDGMIYWTGMWASVVGQLNPATGEMKEFPINPEARAHTVIPDPEGNIWYTGNSNATVGRLNPKTGEYVEFKTQSRDPHSMVYHPNGNIYFTAQGARMVGYVNPRSGEVKEVATEANPYGIRVDSKGTVWVAHNGTNKMASVNPETLEIKLYELPDPESRVRRFDIDSNDMIWFGNAALGRIGRLDPATGEVKEWETPSGPRSHPYGFEIINDIIWFNESGMRPDALVRFDPKTETFQSWAIPSGYGIVRNMWETKDGNLLIHQTSSNRIGLVEISKPLTSSR